VDYLLQPFKSDPKKWDIDQLTKPGPKPTLISEDFSNTFARLRMLKQLIKRAPLGLAGG
jgi:hypothetical protein